MLFEPFLYLTDLKERIDHVETFLLKKVVNIEINDNLFNTIEQMLAAPGRTAVKEICAYSCVSQRQMERLVLQHVGLPLKRIFNLVRYQNVWHDMVSSNAFDIQDAVYRYGYTDQAHTDNEGWMFGIPSNDNYPRAPWWTYNEEVNKVQNVGITATLCAFILRYGKRNSELLEKHRNMQL